MTRTFTLDVESTGTCDLKKAGAAVYWAHPETRIICVCYAIDDGPVVTWRPGDAVPYFVPELNDGRWRIVAHNYLFEFHCWQEQLDKLHGWGRPVFPDWDCTMARALYWGLPAGLIDVADALQLKTQIDTAKKSRIKRMSRPRTTSPLTWWHETDDVKLAELIEDCITDVTAERELDKVLPPLPKREREIFLIDGRINLRGIGVDLPLIDKLQAITDAEGKRLNATMENLTDGKALTTNQTAVIRQHLHLLGCPTDGLAKGDVSAALNAPDNGADGAAVAREILLTRQEAAKASTAKLAAMTAGASSDGRCRGLLQYGGAGRTLRWAGRRVQPQNYPRGTVKNVASVIRMVEAGATVEELAALLPGTVMDAVSSALRGCFVPAPGYVFVSGDLSQIEARVVAWLAGQLDVLAVFARGDDVYTYTARAIGSDSRLLGKILVLACGFGMGPEKFQETAAAYGVILTLAEATACVGGWRDLNDRTVSYWYEIGRMAVQIAQMGHGAEDQVRRGNAVIGFRKTSKALRIVLPSGRELTYQNIEVGNDDFGRPSLSYMGVHPKTKQWDRIRTYGGRLVENIVQAVARDVMAEAMITLSANNARMVMTVHDELLAEAPVSQGKDALDHMLKIMRTTPSWAPGLPVDAAGWTGGRYQK